LRGRRFAGVKFKRQEPLASYIVDFVALDLKLIVEADGGQHGVRAEQDAERTRILREWGYHVVRFWNDDVLHDLDNVCLHILRTVGRHSS